LVQQPLAACHLPIVLLVAAVQVTPAFARPPVQCPAALGQHRLESVEVFHGPQSRLMSLHPGWDLSRASLGPDGVYLVCSFAGTAETREIRLPAGTQGCWFDDHWPRVVCR
jgi:hypothetical protein